MRNRQPAFTILEVLINIAIMSVIIGMIYFIYSAFSKQIAYYRADVEEELAFGNFCLRLKEDFFRAEKITGTAASFETVRYNDERIYYVVKNGYIYRDQKSNRDSLKVDKITVQTKIDPVSNEKVLEKISLGAFLFQKPLTFTAAKKYTEVLGLKEGDHGN